MSVRELADRGGFDDIVRLQSVGADPSGRQPINGVLDETAADGTLVYIGPGRYRLDDQFTFTEFDRFGIVGDDATVVPAEGYDQTLFELGEPGEAGTLVIDGLEFDFRAERTGGRPLVGRVDDRLVFREITVRGEQDVETDTIRIDVTDPEGTGLVERLRLPDGATPGAWDDDSGVTGCEVGSDSQGDLSFVDCRIVGFPDNGLYADPPAGRVSVLGGYFANNGVANVRVEADSGSVVRGVHVRCDEARDGVDNMRGIRLRSGGPILVEDCLVEMAAVTTSDGGITIHSELAAATIRNTRIATDADGVVGVRAKSPSSGIDAGGPVRLEGLHIEGRAERESAIDVTDRENCTVEGVCIHQTGDDRDGIRMDGSAGRVSESVIAVSGRPLVFANSNMETGRLSIHRNPRALSSRYCQSAG